VRHRHDLFRINLRQATAKGNPCKIGAGWWQRSGREVSWVGHPLPTIPQACGRQLQQKRGTSIRSKRGERQQNGRTPPLATKPHSRKRQRSEGKLMCDGADYLLTGGVRLVCVSARPTRGAGVSEVAWAIRPRTADAEWRG